MSRSLWGAYVAVGTAASLAYPAISAPLVQDVVFGVVGLSCVVAIMVGLRVHRPAVRAPWLLMLAGQAVWVVGDTVFDWQHDASHSAVFPSFADGFYLTGYVLVTLGVLALIRGRRAHRDLAGLVDSAVVTFGLALLSWVFIAHPTLNGAQHSVAASIVSIAYPAFDVVLLGGLVRLVLTAGSRTASFRLLMTALALLLVADTATSALNLGGGDSRWCDVGYLLSYVAWGAAALHGSMTELSQRGQAEQVDFTRKRLAALAAATLIAPGVLAAQYLAGARLDVWAVVAGSMVLFGLVVARMRLSIAHIVAEQRHREQLQAVLAFQAKHDALTGLPNRMHALEAVSAALGRARRGGYLAGLLFVDLDAFKKVNDINGHAAGDRVLQIVAGRLHAQVRAGDVVSRLGGDEFVVVLEQLESESDALHIAQRIVATVAEPIALPCGGSAAVGASVGMAIAQDGSIDADRLLHEADTAAYRAKTAGRGRVEVFGEALRAELAARAELEAALVHAMAHDELIVHYQPIVDVTTSQTRGYEALVRWQRPGHGLVPPAEFIPTAEASALICDVDAWVLQRACRQLSEWIQDGAESVTMAVNISGRHLSMPRVVDDVRQALIASGLPGKRLVLEITETVLVENLLALDHLHRLRELGVAVSIDDFGTGYNSITRLRGLPVDIVKIDRSFLSSTGDAQSRKLLELMVHTARAFDLPVVVEGVEHAHQLTMLRDLECESAQGYHLCRPLPAERIVHTSPAANDHDTDPLAFH